MQIILYVGHPKHECATLKTPQIYKSMHVNVCVWVLQWIHSLNSAEIMFKISLNTATLFCTLVQLSQCQNVRLPLTCVSELSTVPHIFRSD